MIQDAMFKEARNRAKKANEYTKRMPCVELGSKTRDGRPNFYRCGCGWGSYYSEYATPGSETKRECSMCHKIF